MKFISKNTVATMFGMTFITPSSILSIITFLIFCLEVWLVKMVSHCFVLHVWIYEQGGPTFHYWLFNLYFAWVQNNILFFIIIKIRKS